MACNFIKKDTLARVFSCKFCEISKNIFFTEHFWTTASVSDSTSNTRPYFIGEEKLRNVLFLILKTLRTRSSCFAALMMNVSLKEAIWKPLNCSKLASIRYKMCIINMGEKKFKALNKKYNLPENCPHMVVPKRNAKIWKNSLTSP